MPIAYVYPPIFANLSNRECMYNYPKIKVYCLAAGVLLYHRAGLDINGQICWRRICKSSSQKEAMARCPDQLTISAEHICILMYNRKCMVSFVNRYIILEATYIVN